MRWAAADSDCAVTSRFKPGGGGLMLVLFALTASLSSAQSETTPSPQPKQSTCTAGSGEATARLIQSRYDGIRDIHANFEQTNESASFAGQPMMTAEAKTGRVVFAKPGKMRWTYLEPEPSVVVSDGRLLWIHDVAGKSVTRLEVTAGFLSGAALQFLLGDGQILESFEVEAKACDPERITLDLTPRAEATYERLGLVADRVSGDIVATSVTDLFGNLTEIRFREIEINRGTPPATFEFEIPDGVEVIDYAGSAAGSTGR
jgi:outer membrane lipoprotein carrier protein